MILSNDIALKQKISDTNFPIREFLIRKFSAREFPVRELLSVCFIRVC
jgi:hypothetical protein